MAKQSAGILLYQRSAAVIEVLLVHPGGPFYARKDDGVWSIPKGEFEADEPAVAAARREFAEEMGVALPPGELTTLGTAKLKSGKIIYAWALEASFNVAALSSNRFELEWPPKSGRQQTFPEIDRAAWFPLAAAQRKIHPGQLPLLEALANYASVALPTMLEQSSLF